MGLSQSMSGSSGLPPPSSRTFSLSAGTQKLRWRARLSAELLPAVLRERLGGWGESPDVSWEGGECVYQISSPPNSCLAKTLFFQQAITVRGKHTTVCDATHSWWPSHSARLEALEMVFSLWRQCGFLIKKRYKGKLLIFNSKWANI